MSFLSLPNELLQIVDEFNPRELNLLILTNRRLAFLLTPLLHTFAIQDKGHQAALHWAACRGHEGLVSLLVERGTNINLRGELYRTPLHSATKYGQSGTIKLLLKKGANITLTDGHGLTALQYASTLGHENVVSALLDAFHSHRTHSLDHQAGTELYSATRRDRPFVSGQLIKKRAYINFGERLGGNSALHFSAEFGNESVARLLLENEAKIDMVRRYNRRTALYLAVRERHTDVVRLLLGKGADVNLKDTDGRTVLYMVVRRVPTGKDLTLCKLLLENGADPAAEDHDGKTPAFLGGEVWRQTFDTYA